MEKRGSGVLLHPTALANPWGIGDFGETAHRFLDWLHQAGQTVWQLLPLGPPGLGRSPYDARSSYAGDLALIDLQELVDPGLLAPADVEPRQCPYGDRIDADSVYRFKTARLRQAWTHLMASETRTPMRERLEGWIRAPEQTGWLADWSLYAALRDHHEGRSWTDWPPALRDRDAAAIDVARAELADSIRFHEFVQFLFFEQLERLRAAARSRGITLLGDLPFYVALDSCDVWARRDLFDLDPAGTPRHVAGVPPDYFSASGQRWGNPIYRWDRLAAEDFGWWIERLAAQLRTVERLRLDHFRAFAGYWEIPADEPTAIAGHWRDGPGYELFRAAESRLGSLPFVAEDLGLITPDVEELRQRLGIPGMRVLQFGFDAADSPHAPHNLPRDVVLYTGTHDNDTARGWIRSIDADLRRRALDYLGAEEETFPRALLRAAQSSVARLVITPIQDVLGLDGMHRINTPGTTSGNWNWRMPTDSLTPEIAADLRRLAELTGRLPPPAATDDAAG